MVERQDIDALLIGALYGELTPAEESRLASHLESHPADRTALADLTHAREVIQHSRILAFQYEPAQSVSALLMQEASRRAPRAAREGEGWFARFVASFVRHPAMAAAAMLVVVVGAAALVTRNSDQPYATTEPVSVHSADRSVAAPAQETPNAAPAAVATGSAMAGDEDQFRVGLEETAQQQPVAAAEPAMPAPTGNKPATRTPAPRADDALGFEPAAKSKGKLDQGIEVARNERQVKDFDDEAPTADRKRETARGGEGAASGGYLADGVAPAAGAPAKKAPAAPKQSVGALSASPPPPPVTAAAEEKSAELRKDAVKEQKPADKAANDPETAWARDQHAAVIAAVKKNECQRAANLALAIEGRAPAYYAQNVANDRSVKDCVAYINAQRDRDYAKNKRANERSVNEPSPTAPKRAVNATETNK